MTYYKLPEWAAWLASIREQPDDDHRRLFCADWLDELETDEASWRANYIRTMIADKIGNIEYGGWESGNPFGYDFGLSANPSNRVVLTAHRGFIYRVSAPLAVLSGGGCRGGCEGGGRWAEWGTSRQCPHCHGTGRTPGVLGELLRREPLTAAGIEVTDREPQEDGGEFMWASASDTSTWRFDVHQESLPMDIAKRLTGGRHHPESRSIVAQWWYDTEDAARLALGAALVRLHGPKSEVLT